MAAPSGPQYTTPPHYTPAPHLVDSSTLAAEDFIRYFQDFYLSLEYISYAPALVFERLMANAISSKSGLLSRQTSVPNQGVDCDAHLAALEECRNEINTLRLENEQLKAKPTEAQLNETKPARTRSAEAETEIEPPTPKIVAYRGPNIGVFYSGDIESSINSLPREITFSRPYARPPGIMVGVRGIATNMQSRGSYVSSFATNIQKDTFALNYQQCNTIASTWLEVDPGDTDFQFGEFRVIKSSPTYQQHRITFPHAYKVPPQVVVFLSKFDPRGPCTGSALNITSTGFSLLVTFAGATFVNDTVVSWISCTTNKPNVCTGTVVIGDLNKNTDIDLSINGRAGFTMFKNRNFTAPPRVFLAFNSLKLSKRGNFELVIRSPIIETTGMTWDIKAWSNDIEAINSRGIL